MTPPSMVLSRQREVQGGYIPVPGGYIPVQGGYIPVQGGYIVMSNGTNKTRQEED